jgi:hypothetical protein
VTLVIEPGGRERARFVGTVLAGDLEGTLSAPQPAGG